MYTINCSYYTKSFPTINQLVDTIVRDGMDPNYEILKDGQPTGEMVIDLIRF
jgi:hypothetical protein